MAKSLLHTFGRALGTAPIGLIPLFLFLLAFNHPADPAASTTGPVEAESPLDRLESRAASLDDGITGVEAFYHEHVEPVERILVPYHEDERWVRRIAVSLVLEGRHTGMDPRALASVLLVENPWLDPKAESFMGAVGLMQVMPFHAGHWGCGSADLTDVEVNICHGSRIFARYLERHGDVDRALLAYNGCVRGTNTPDCHLYPNHVYSRAGRAAMGRWLRGE